MNIDFGDPLEEQEQPEEAACDYGFGVCIDPFCRDVESCVGCRLQHPIPEQETTA